MSPNQLLLSYALRYPSWIVLTMILGFSSALFNGVSSTLIVPLVLGFLGKGDINLKVGPPIIQKILSLFSGGEGNNLMVMTGVVVLAIVLKNVAVYLNAIVSGHLSRKLVKDIRKEGIKLILEVDIDFFAKTKIGDIINQISNEVGRAAGAIRIAINIFTTSATILTFVCILLSISWKLTIASTGLLLLVAGTNQYLIRRAKGYGKILSDKSRSYSTALLEILTGIRLIKAVSKEEAEYQRIEQFIDERERADELSQANFDAVGPINEVTGTLAILAIVFLGRAFFWQQIETLSTFLLIYL